MHAMQRFSSNVKIYASFLYLTAFITLCLEPDITNPEKNIMNKNKETAFFKLFDFIAS